MAEAARTKTYAFSTPYEKVSPSKGECRRGAPGDGRGTGGAEGWGAVIFESASSLQITLQSSASINVGDYGAEGPVGGANVLRPLVTYGPLPSTYPSITSSSFDTANIPRI